ncbi:uncharacterized protein [Rutidosis leptorrhynchoides]|uniref:uncharacterized protein n=1 Tax=Rutidosis leptorrhynchoides TaxID=125765 RepID=UPI003A98F2E7
MGSAILRPSMVGAPPVLSDYLNEFTNVNSLHVMLRERHEQLRTLRNALSQANIKMNLIADKHITDLEFQTLWVRLHRYKQLLVGKRINQKLSKRYFDPYAIEKNISVVAYKLKLPECSKIHPVFHISLMKKFKGDGAFLYQPLSELDNGSGPILVPQHVLDNRQIVRDGNVVNQVLIK